MVAMMYKRVAGRAWPKVDASNLWDKRTLRRCKEISRGHVLHNLTVYYILHIVGCVYIHTYICIVVIAIDIAIRCRYIAAYCSPGRISGSSKVHEKSSQMGLHVCPVTT